MAAKNAGEEAAGAAALAEGGGALVGILGPALLVGCGCMLFFFLFFGGMAAIGAYALNNSDTSSPAASVVTVATAGATPPNSVAQITVKKGKVIIPADPKAGPTLIIPATEGKVGSEGATSGLAFSCSSSEIKYYINMRWPSQEWSWSGHDKQYDNTLGLYGHKKVVVLNLRTKKSVVAPICESGPAPWTGSHMSSGNAPSYWKGFERFDPAEYDQKHVGRIAGLAPAAMSAIGAQEDEIVQIGFATDQSIAIGPVK